MIKKNEKTTELSLSEAERSLLIKQIEKQRIELEILTGELKLARDIAEKANRKINAFNKFATVGFFMLDPDGTVSDMNQSSIRILNLERSSLINKKFQLFVTEDTRQIFNDFLLRVFVSNVIETCEVMVKVKENYSIFLHVEGIVPENDNKCFITVIDITDRHLAEQTVNHLLIEKDIILKEVHHRVKNNMYNIGALLNMQANSEENPATKSVLFDAAGRVQSMSVLYDKLYRSEYTNAVSIKEYFPDLIYEIVDIFPQKRSVKVKTEIDDIVLDAKVLSILGILINELITNSMKYAFIGRDDGLITVTASMKDKRLSIAFADNGPGIPESVTFTNSKGFGMQLISMLVEQLKGTAVIERNTGTRCIIEFEV